MKYEIVPTSKFRRDLKAVVKRGYDVALLETAVEIIASGEVMPEKYRDHSLSGNWINHRECHIAPDWLLIYKIDDDILVLTLTRTGSHSDLF